MSKNKTAPTNISVDEFLQTVTDETKRNDSVRLIQIMKELTGYDPKMWGPNIVGFGTYHYKYESGREGDAPLVGFSPRAKAISLYLYQEFTDKEKLLQQFGKHTAGVGCIYIKKLQDIDIEVLRKLIRNSVEYLHKKYPSK
jgi:nucleoid DNA-binding protein